MLSVVIPTFNAEATLAPCMAALVPAVIDGLVREVIVADGGSQDRTLRIVEQAGAKIVVSGRGRGLQIASGVSSVKTPWILILHADTVLEHGWSSEAASFMQHVDEQRRPLGAAAFQLALDDHGLAPRLVEFGARSRAQLLKRPYGDQGLLIPRVLYERIGGIKPLPIMEDLDLVKRIGRDRMTILRSKAVTSPLRYRTDGYVKRVLKNQYCLALFALGVPLHRIARVYAGEPALEPTGDFLPGALEAGEENKPH